jgi:hypothetical protein
METERRLLAISIAHYSALSTANCLRADDERVGANAIEQWFGSP